ncbi:MAG: SGNH hydrolase domain-containing protein [Actinomycetota bacterium]
MLRRTATRALSASAALLVMMFGLVGPAAKIGAAVATPDQRLQAELTAQLRVHVLPTDLTPGLHVTSLNIYAQGGATFPMKGICAPYGHLEQANHPTPCWVGDSTASKTIAIFGDSMALNWIPALDTVAKHLHFKVAMFSFSGCVAAHSISGPAGPGWDQAHVNACMRWHDTLPIAIRALAPEAVIVANGTPTLGYDTDTKWLAGLKLEFDLMQSATYHPKRIMMGFTPHLSWNVLACLSSHRTAINSCTLQYSPTESYGYGASLRRDQRAVSLAKVTLVPAARWFCVAGNCPVVLGNTLIYVDGDHTTKRFSLQLAGALEAALTPLLTH